MGNVQQKPLPVGRVTFLFTDIERSTRLLQRMGSAYPKVLERHRELLRASTLEAGGAVVDSVGDGFFAAFETPRSAVGAAIDATLEMSSQDWPRGGAVRVRVGVHTGEPSRLVVGSCAAGGVA